MAPDWLESPRPLFDFCAKRASVLAFGTFVLEISNRHHPPKRLVFGRRNVLLLTKVSFVKSQLAHPELAERPLVPENLSFT